MIIVNIRVPALEKVYNFSIDEKVRTADFIEEIVEIIKQKEGVRFHGDIESFALCSVENGVNISRDRSLGEYGIRGGDELVLV